MPRGRTSVHWRVRSYIWPRVCVCGYECVYACLSWGDGDSDVFGGCCGGGVGDHCKDNEEEEGEEIAEAGEEQEEEEKEEEEESAVEKGRGQGKPRRGAVGGPTSRSLCRVDAPALCSERARGMLIVRSILGCTVLFCMPTLPYTDVER